MIKRELAASIRPDTLIVRSFVRSATRQRCDYVDYKTRCNSIPVITRPLFSDLGNSRMSRLEFTRNCVFRVGNRPIGSIFFPIRRGIGG